MSRLAGRIKVTFNNASFQEEFDLKFPSRNSRSTAGPATYAPSSFPLEAALSPSLIWKCPLFCLEERCCHRNGTHRVNSLANTLQISYAIFANTNSPSYPTPLPSSSERKPWKLETKNILAWLFEPHGAACEPCMATITVSIDTYRHIMGHCYPDGAFPSAFFFVSVLAGSAPVSLAVCSVSFFSLPLSVLLPPLRLQSGGSQAGWRQWSPTRLSEGQDCPGWTSGAQFESKEDVGAHPDWAVHSGDRAQRTLHLVPRWQQDAEAGAALGNMFRSIFLNRLPVDTAAKQPGTSPECRSGRRARRRTAAGGAFQVNSGQTC